ncbi:coiled-coil domain-containing protein 18 isoform X2 [Pristis pectinata]|uniref:coiled-coil domain-containing protein 18 isoform X2 n=1 Tax=Pristis pectinata TaxID=685728 RepID=UPI00223DDD36|nr:coiled-coil domain-containing protein 18 isoform X2 [Pristis pectinata]
MTVIDALLQKGKWMDNLVALRKRLMKTEKSLQSSRIDFNSSRLNDQSDDSPKQDHTPALTMEDLFQYNPAVPPMNKHHPTAAEKTLPQKNVFSNISPTSSFGGRTPHLPTISGVEQENEQLWRKLSSLREDNARLVSQNHSLVREIESIQMELTESKAKFCHLEPSINEKAHHISQLNEDILGLEAEVEAQEKALRVAEEKLEESQWMVAEKDKLVEKLSEECKRIKNELYEQSRRGKRAEQQRNEALFNAEELSAAFKRYKEKTAEKFTKFRANEEDWQSSLDHCDKDREELYEKCTTLEKELEKKNEEIRLLMEQNCDLKVVQKDLEAKNSGLFSVLSDAKEKVKMLENELANKETVLKDREGLRLENAELRLLTTSQNEKMLQFSKELESTKLEMRNLESLLQLHRTGNKEGESGIFSAGITSASCLDVFSSTRKENEMKDSKLSADFGDSLFTDTRLKLGMKGSEIQKLQSSLTNSKVSKQQCPDVFDKSGDSLDRISPELTSHRKKNTERKTLEQHLEEKRCKQKEVEELQTKLLEAECTISTLENRMTEQINSFQNFEEQLLEKEHGIEKLEQELKKTKSQLSTMEKQLEEKTIAYSTNAVKVVECEQALAEKNNEIIKLEKLIEEQQQENIVANEQTKKLQTEQCHELEKQIEILESELEEKQVQIIKQKQTISTFQDDIYAKESRIESLEFLLEETRQESKKQNERSDATLKALQTQVGEGTSKVKELETALVKCKEELKMQLQQVDENREQQEKQLRKKSEEVHRLQKELKMSAHNLKEANEQNVQLQQTLLQYQQMLQQGTARIGDLEDHQAVLEREVSKLEQELLKQKMSFTDELSKAEGKLFKAYEEQDSKHQQVSELTSAMKDIKTEMEKCKDEVTVLEKELFQLRRDITNKDVYLNQLEMTLHNAQAELNKKSEQVHDLEENLHQTESDRRNSVQKAQEMDNQLKNMYKELQDTLDQLKELRDVLQKAQNSIEEKNYTIEELTNELRQCKGELQERDAKIIDMDQALKDRQWELQQRAARLTQLDMDVREHKTEMEQKIIYLQGSLEKSELTIKECNKQVGTLDEKLQLTQEQLCEKDFVLLQKEQQINQLKCEVEGKHLQIEEYEQILKSKEQCILKQQQEVLGESQQVRLAREQMQRCHLELRETQQRLAQEAYAVHLAEDLSAAQVRETQLEIKTQAEIKKLKELVEHLKNAHEKEINVLKESRLQLLASTEESSATHMSNEQVLQLKQELEKSQETILHLESELHTQREVISAAKEALIIKESEVARLQVKISGFERAKGKQQLPSPMPQPQNEAENRKDSTMQAWSFYPFAKNMNRSFSVNDMYGTDIGSALNSLNCSNRIREILEQSFNPANISSQDIKDISCPEQPEGAALLTSSPKAETEEDLELTNLASNSNLETLSGMINHLIAKEQNNTKLGSPVDKSPGLSSEQIKSRAEECSAGRRRISNQDSACCSLNDPDINVPSHSSLPLKYAGKCHLLQLHQCMNDLSEGSEQD